MHGSKDQPTSAHSPVTNQLTSTKVTSGGINIHPIECPEPEKHTNITGDTHLAARLEQATASRIDSTARGMPAPQMGVCQGDGDVCTGHNITLSVHGTTNTASRHDSKATGQPLERIVDVLRTIHGPRLIRMFSLSLFPFLKTKPLPEPA